MTIARRLLLLVSVALVVVSTAFPAVAVEEPETTEGTTETTVATEGTTETTVATEDDDAAANVPPPAVTVPDTAADEETADWTYRYLIPTLLALAVLVVIATTVQYFVRVVRNRYKVVE